MNSLNRIFDELEAEAIERARHAAEDLGIGDWFTPRASQDTAAAKATVEHNHPEGTPMSKLTDDLHAAATRLEAIGEDGAAILEAVSGNPATKELLGVLHALTGVNVDPSLISLLGVGLKELLARAQPQQAAA